MRLVKMQSETAHFYRHKGNVSPVNFYLCFAQIKMVGVHTTDIVKTRMNKGFFKQSDVCFQEKSG